ncbi:MAG: hypothetical protein JWL69_3554, partial [Phycisphaerales bacterium]|nr:hypothetical protein [Phycisphaerales bacterium]
MLCDFTSTANNLANQLSTVQQPVQNALGGLQNTPLIGGNANQTNFIPPNVINQLKQTIAGITDGSTLQSALWNALGPSGLNVLANQNPSADGTLEQGDVVV